MEAEAIDRWKEVQDPGQAQKVWLGGFQSTLRVVEIREKVKGGRMLTSRSLAPAPSISQARIGGYLGYLWISPNGGMGTQYSVAG